jgi:hypothetical protein
VDQNNHNQNNLPRTEPDFTINMQGHIVGMALSPDHRYGLYEKKRKKKRRALWPVSLHVCGPHFVEQSVWERQGEKVLSLLSEQP